MYSLCVSSAVNMQCFVWKFLCTICNLSFIHSLKKRMKTPMMLFHANASLHREKVPPPAPESKPRRGRPPGPKHHRVEREEVEEAAGVSDTGTRRLTRRSTVDSHFSDDVTAPATPTKRQKKQVCRQRVTEMDERRLHE